MPFPVKNPFSQIFLQKATMIQYPSKKKISYLNCNKNVSQLKKEVTNMDVGTNNPNSISFNARKQELEAEDEILKKQQQREKHSPFSDFAQLNLKNTEYLIALNKQNPNALNILLFFMQHSNGLNKILCSQQVLMEYFGLSRSTVSRCITVLKEHGFIYIVKSGTANIYILNSDLVWKSWGKNIQYCEFPANVVLSMSEQKNYKKVLKDKITKSKAPSLTLSDEAIEEHNYSDPF